MADPRVTTIADRKDIGWDEKRTLQAPLLTCRAFAVKKSVNFIEFEIGRRLDEKEVEEVMARGIAVEVTCPRKYA